MQNMKKILSALTALSFVTVAGVSTVACNKSNTDSKDISMDKVFFDLELYDEKGNSQVEAWLNIQDNSFSWTTNKLNDLTAINLLTSEDKAKSEESFNFLTNVLKLETKGGKKWSDKTFDRLKTNEVSLTVISIDPILKPINDDYAVSDGTVTIQWTNNKTNFGEYFVNLKTNETKGIIKQYLPIQLDLDWPNFDKENGPLVFFKLEKSITKLPVGSDITDNLIVNRGKGKELSTIAKNITQPLKLIITKINSSGIRFEKGDTLIFKISLGSVQFSTEYTLTLE